MSASLGVVPAILPGDKVRLQFCPRFITPDGRSIELASMTAEVVMANGQSLVVGGSEEPAYGIGAALFSAGDKGEHRMLLVVTTHIHGAP